MHLYMITPGFIHLLLSEEEMYFTCCQPVPCEIPVLEFRVGSRKTERKKRKMILYFQPCPNSGWSMARSLGKKENTYLNVVLAFNLMASKNKKNFTL